MENGKIIFLKIFRRNLNSQYIFKKTLNFYIIKEL